MRPIVIQCDSSARFRDLCTGNAQEKDAGVTRFELADLVMLAPESPD
jgi:hypothetical protein